MIYTVTRRLGTRAATAQVAASSQAEAERKVDVAMSRYYTGPSQPYTTAWLGRDRRLHLIRTALGRGQYRAACGDQEAVSRLKDRGAAEVLYHGGGDSYDKAVGLCRVCFGMGFFYHLGREAVGKVAG